ncbi:MAG: urate hydroxylase PuuD [Ignavibacteriales bacterium]|nr:urate hydroxylase PuuD [Ignavibacteriales bacterium]
MEIADVISVLTRWLHVAAGILWIGYLYFFNFASAQFLPSLEGDTKNKVLLGLQPRALYWFRWGAAYTWITGILLLALVYYHGGLMFEANNTDGWTAGAVAMLAVTFLFFVVYDMLAKSGLAKNGTVFGIVGVVLIAVVTYLMVDWARFSFRAYNIHIGAMFGTIMAANVWMRIWPAQKRVLAAVKEGTAPDAAVAAAALARSRHNTFLSVPLLWTMINAHTAVPAASHWLYLIGVVVLGWVSVWLVYGKASKLKGM